MATASQLQTIPDLIRSQAGRYGRKPAIVHGSTGRMLTYAELPEAAARLGGLFRAAGVGAGQRVALPMPNTLESVQEILGLWWIGAAPIALDVRTKPAEALSLLSRCAPSWFVSPNRLSGDSQPRGWPCPALDMASCDVMEGPEPEGSMDAGDPALIWPTSGTTGLPKGVILSHRALLARWRVQKDWLGQDDSMVSLCVLPLHFGVVHPCMSVLYSGGTVVLCSPFDSKNFAELWNAALRYDVNTMMLTPPLARLLIDMAPRLGRIRRLSLRQAYCTGAPLGSEDVATFERIYGGLLLNIYGLKETGPIATAIPDKSRRALDTVGPIHHGKVRILKEDGREAKSGEPGEIVFSGETLATGYCDGAGVDASEFRDGWFHTKDVGRLDAWGNLSVLGRLSATIVSGGANVRPEEVEEALRSHPDVLDAAVLGLADSLLGESVAACIVAKPGARVTDQDMLRHCRRLLADYKCPRRIQLVPSIPRNSLGKSSRERLLRLFARP